jgi:hypothetical protein
MAKEKVNKEKWERYPDKLPDSELAFTGIARSVQCFMNNGKFRDFRIVTLTIQDGMVIDVKYSDPYASWETIAKLEVISLNSVNHLNTVWKDGRTLSK